MLFSFIRCSLISSLKCKQVCKPLLSRKEQVTYLLIQQSILYALLYENCGPGACKGASLRVLEVDCLGSDTTRTVAVEAFSTLPMPAYFTLTSRKRLPAIQSQPPLLKTLPQTLVTNSCVVETYLLRTGARSARIFHRSPGATTPASYSGARSKWEVQLQMVFST